MADFLAALVVTIALTGTFVYLLVSTDVDEIMGNWETRRCEVPIMLGAGMFKPKDDPRTRTQFGTDNFQFCMKSVIDSVLRIAMAPLYAIMGKTMGALENVESPLNFLRGMLNNSVNVFGKYFDGVYTRFKATTYVSLAIQQRILFAMSKITGMVYSLIYIGLSAKTLTDNFIAFTSQVIKVFLIILIVMIILIFFILIPVLPLILTVIGVLASQGIEVPGAGAFCIDPEATIMMEDGTRKRLGEIRLGDRLSGQQDNVVEGILRVTRDNEPCVTIDGVIMSGSHRVKCGEKWGLANTHPRAIPTESSKNPVELICLNTRKHIVPILTEHNSILYASDWEEVDSEKGRKVWIDLVNLTLNGGDSMVTHYPTSVPLVSYNTKVAHKYKGYIPICEVMHGDEIVTRNGKFTRVRGTYKGIIQVEDTIPSGFQTVFGIDWIIWSGLHGGPLLLLLPQVPHIQKTKRKIYRLT